MKNRLRLIIEDEQKNKVIFKFYRLNYPYGKKSKPTKILLKTKTYKLSLRDWKKKQRKKNAKRNS